jgi:mannose-6-phosphate isomerase-like protein (cupin superfamily)
VTVSGNVVHRSEALAWEVPLEPPHNRVMGVLFERDITPTRNVSAGFVLIPAGSEQPKLSSHDGVEEIYYVLRGSGSFVLGDETVPVRPGSAVYVGSGVPHRAINGPDEEMELLWFNSPPAFGPVGGYQELTRDWRDVQGQTHPGDG